MHRKQHSFSQDPCHIVIQGISVWKLFQTHSFSVSTYSNSGYCLSFETVDGSATRAKAEPKEKRRARNLRRRFAVCTGGLVLHLVEATENENGDGVGKGGCAGEYPETGETVTPDIDLHTL